MNADKRGWDNLRQDKRDRYGRGLSPNRHQSHPVQFRLYLRLSAFICGCFLLQIGLARAEPGLPQVHPGARSSYSALLMWHDVVERKKEVWFDTTVAELEEQFRSIQRHHLQPVSLDRLADHLESGASLPPGAVVLTFDDNNLGL